MNNELTQIWQQVEALRRIVVDLVALQRLMFGSMPANPMLGPILSQIDGLSQRLEHQRAEIAAGVQRAKGPAGASGRD